ncbi:UbiA family prenyltransferase [Fodinicola acaciae]|uniref:UbiA family prenyltransferase n=1 Tax=Fodinicola acaciae TaxID=2681555 RepID=UPI0013D43F07|nr:UbiA family prenyltransferase [Fodinicola acaciae]
MIRRLRLVVVVARPAVCVLLAMYAGIGFFQSGHREDFWLLFRVLLAVAGFLAFSVACNDIADERIDRVNLGGDRRRPLVTGFGRRTEIRVIGATAAIVALAASASLGWLALLVLSCGLVLSAGYSIRPVRIADRGAVASLMLPACYVAVPYLLGHIAGGSTSSVWLLAGLYVGFIGRILLKDFRDVRGDALFGKRTFLVRHGRRWTCVFSACCLAIGGALLVATVSAPSAILVTGYLGGTAASIALLFALAKDRGPRRDEAVISAIAIVGRGVLLVLLMHLGALTVHLAALPYNLLQATLIAITATQAVMMFRSGPPFPVVARFRQDMAPWTTSATSSVKGPDGARTAVTGRDPGPLPLLVER